MSSNSGLVTRFPKLATLHKPTGHSADRIAALADQYSKERAKERREHWLFLGIIAVAYAATVIGTAAAIKWLLS